MGGGTCRVFIACLGWVSLLGCGVAFGQRVSGELDRLSKEWKKAYDNQRFEEAIVIGLDLAQRKPGDPQPAYNLACCYAQEAQYEKAVEWLGAAADRGFYYTSTVLRDEDLDEIRDKPGFAAALEKIRKNNAAELEKFKAKADKAKVITVAPPGLDANKAVPLVVALHGYGSDANDIATTWREAAGRIGAVLIAPQALQPAGNGFSWGVVEQGEFLVLRAIEKARTEFNIDPKRIVVTGFSQGGGMSYTMALRHPEMFAGVIPVAGYYEHRVDPIPATAGAKLPRFFIMVGEKDDAVEINQEAAKRLEAIGVPMELRVYPKLGHRFPPEREKEMDAALKFVLESGRP